MKFFFLFKQTTVPQNNFLCVVHLENEPPDYKCFLCRNITTRKYERSSLMSDSHKKLTCSIKFTKMSFICFYCENFCFAYFRSRIWQKNFLTLWGRRNVKMSTYYIDFQLEIYLLHFFYYFTQQKKN